MFDVNPIIFNRWVPTTLTLTSEVTLYTAPNPWTNVHKVHVSNSSASIVTVTVSVYDLAGTALYHWCSVKDVPANDCIDMEMDFQLEEGDEIRATAGAANDLDVIVVLSEGRGRSG